MNGFPSEHRGVTRRRFLTAAGFAACSGLWAADSGNHQVPTVDDEVRRAASSAPLRMMFKGSSGAELLEWQASFKAELLRRIGPHSPPAQWTSGLLSTTDLGDHSREDWLLKADGVPALPLYVLKPRGHEGERLPVVLAVHGHGNYGNDAVVGIESTPERAAEIREFHYDYGRQFVRKGFLVVAPCLTPFGRR